MTLHVWWLFVGVCFLLSGTPGPNMLHILSRSVELGMRRSTAAMAGCLTAIVSVLAASAAGLTTLLLAVPGAFDVLRYTGVAYLLYLGVKAWRSDDVAGTTPLDAGGDPQDKRLRPTVSALAVYRGGFMISISNPKLILFAVAFLPQFINPALAKAPQFAILVLTFAVIEAFWYGIYATGGRSLSRFLDRPAIR
ncbi:MAG TPA: LysE family translocator, partial [Novosphingobium sp.]|nr:LysE family translocator [Novosphingobium sp.]